MNKRVDVIDSHTGGEPTRIVVSGGPDLGAGPLSERREIFRDRHDDFRAAVVNEPRGGEVWVGGILCSPADPGSTAGAIFFNNVGVLHMCGHGIIGLLASLHYLDRIQPGNHIIETPAGNVKARLHRDGRVTVTNVASYRYRSNVTLDVSGEGSFTGDVAWGGNWFFLISNHDEKLCLQNIERLTTLTKRIREQLGKKGITGKDSALIDHIELFGPGDAGMDSRNFVLCPGDAYDRSPCGTGTSAKIACLMSDNQLEAGKVWKQQSIVGSVFEATGSWSGEHVIPEITGKAFVNAEASLIFNDKDPFQMGLPRNNRIT